MRQKELKYQNTVTIIFGAFLANFIGFYNGYPLVYPDTGTYLASGFSGQVPMDRTIFYGLFIRHISLSASPWLIVFAQGFIVSWLIHLSLGVFFKGVKRNIVFLGVLTLIILTTGFSYNVSILIPDIFTAVALLSLLNLLFNNNLDKIKTILLSLTFVFSLSTHLSNIPTFALLFIMLIAIGLFRTKKKQANILTIKRLILPLALYGFTLLFVPSVNLFMGSKFQFSSGAHVFMMNHFIENGILVEYLKDNCDHSDKKICKYKDALSWDFIWDEHSILYKTGGWAANKNEYNEIIYDIYTTPKYWPVIIQKSIEYTFKQFFTFDVSVSSPQIKGSAPYGQINWRFHDSEREYLTSKQNFGKLSVSSINLWQTFVIIISLIITFALAFFSLPLKVDSNLKWQIIVVLLYGIINSAVCSNLSTIDPRFQNRWIWLLPVLAIIGLIKLYEQNERERKS